ncbi:MAG: acetyl-CoA carboxylase carboxyltransferase subunit, partial [Myxococcota bacterium]
PTTRVAVMGPAGKEFVYKKELRALRSSVPSRVAEATQVHLAAGLSEAEAHTQAKQEVAHWLAEQEAGFNARYERELMNPREALSLGSISELVMPGELRQEIGRHLCFLMRHTTPSPMMGVQREFH